MGIPGGWAMTMRRMTETGEVYVRKGAVTRMRWDYVILGYAPIAWAKELYGSRDLTCSSIASWNYF